MLPLGELAFTTSEGPKCGLDTVVADAFGCSKNEASRVRRSGGVRVDGEVVRLADVLVSDLDGKTLEAGEKGPVVLHAD